MLAQQNICFSWSWRNHSFPWRNNCFRGKSPHADQLPDVIKTQKNFKYIQHKFTPYSANTLENTDKNMNDYSLKTVYPGKKVYLINQFFFKLVLPKCGEWHTSVIVYLKRSLPGPNMEQPHMATFIQRGLDYSYADIWILLMCLNKISLAAPTSTPELQILVPMNWSQALKSNSGLGICSSRKVTSRICTWIYNQILKVISLSFPSFLKLWRDGRF